MYSNYVRATCLSELSLSEKSYTHHPENKDDEQILITMRYSLEILKTAMHFSIKDRELMEALIPFDNPDDLSMAISEMGLSLPFKDMTLSFDGLPPSFVWSYTTENGLGPDKDKPRKRAPTCFLARAVTHDIITLIPWICPEDKPKDHPTGWGVEPFGVIISLSGKFKNRTDLHKYYEGEVLNHLKSTDSHICVSRSLLSFTATPEIYELTENLLLDKINFIFLGFLYMLNTKGLQLETVVTSQKLNKKRREKGKPEFPEYKVLKIPYIKTSQKHNPTFNEDKIKKRMHLCRGHIKHYGVGENQPLFGKLIGPFWFDPHVRGLGGGLVIKDYKML